MEVVERRRALQHGILFLCRQGQLTANMCDFGSSPIDSLSLFTGRMTSFLACLMRVARSTSLPESVFSRSLVARSGQWRIRKMYVCAALT